MVCAAHETDVRVNEKVDTVIINSVIQYFPGESYLSEVIAKSIPLLNENGRIIIGDVRDLRLLGLFKSRLFLSKLPADTDKKEFSYVVDQEVSKEEELCVAPDYFYNLRSVYPEITHVDIQWKQGEPNNELFAYRYTVVLHTNASNEALDPDWTTWNDIADKQLIKDQLRDLDGLIAISDVPNFRLGKEALLEKGLNDGAIITAGELLNYISVSDEDDSKYLNEIILAAKEYNHQCNFFLNKDPLKLNLLIAPSGEQRSIQPHYDHDKSDKVQYTSIPLLSTICAIIQRNIYKELVDKLPGFMVPANLIILSRMPLTNNGKTDRQFLMARNGLYRAQPNNYRGPRNDIERKLAIIWQDLLGIEKVSIDDNFFELGGNSLIAIRMMITQEKQTGKDLPLSSLFEYPTIEQLALIIQSTHAEQPGRSKCLVRLKPEGNKIPLYIVHGWGLTVFLFKDLAKNLDPEQPVFALQGIGVDGTEEPLTESVEDIAARYISEILEQNPTGPYAFAGYSLGGVIVCEIVKQLRILDKQITMVAMFDAYAHSIDKKGNTNLSIFNLNKLNKLLLRVTHNAGRLIKDPNARKEKLIQLSRKLPNWLKKNNVIKLKKDNDVDFYSNDLSKIYFKAAAQNYKLTANEDTIELFRATKNIYYYMDDPLYLGWQQYAKTVNLHQLKGTHTTMFMSPNDTQFAEILQQCLDKANNNVELTNHF